MPQRCSGGRTPRAALRIIFETIFRGKIEWVGISAKQVVRQGKAICL